MQSASARVKVDLQTVEAACEAYKTDHGGYPQDNPQAGAASVTNDLDPRISWDCRDAAYQQANLFLYQQLTGDLNANNVIDARETGRGYLAGFVRPYRLDPGFATTGTIRYISDPYFCPYGYSTAGMKAEQDFRARLETLATRPAARGYNESRFDLWTTHATKGASAADQEKWTKNW